MWGAREEGRWKKAIWRKPPPPSLSSKASVFCVLACAAAPLEILVVAIVSRFTEPPSVYGNSIFPVSLLSIFNRLCLSSRKNVTAREKIFSPSVKPFLPCFPSFLFLLFSRLCSHISLFALRLSRRRDLGGESHRPEIYLLFLPLSSLCPHPSSSLPSTTTFSAIVVRRC